MQNTFPKKFLSLLICFSLMLPIFASLEWIKPIDAFAKEDIAREEAISHSLSEKGDMSHGEKFSPKGKRYILKFKNSVSLNVIEELLKGIDYSLLAESESRLFAVGLKDEVFFKKNKSYIEYYEADFEREASAINDPMESTDLSKIGVYDAWENAKAHSGITIAVLDTGVYRSHEDLKNVKILSGYDAVAKTAKVNNDSAGHGTAVIGIIAATANNGLGIAGVANGATILPIKVSVSGTTIYSSDLIRGIRFAADAGAKIINMSVGGYSYSVAEQEAINYAAEKGCILIGAAGNGGNRGYADQKSYPASYENVISVASCDENGNRSDFSQYNDMVDVAVIGENITVPDIASSDAYKTDSGTSFSCAIVSGIAALCMASAGKDARFESAEFEALLINTLGANRTQGFGYGIIDAKKMSDSAKLPIITGVSNGITYSNSVKIGFNRGTALLNGESIKDGESVFDNGAHTLTVADGSNKTTLRFKLNYDPLNYEFREFSTYCYFKFDRGTALLNGFPYRSEEKITRSGKHTFILTDGEERLQREITLNYSLPKVYGIENNGVYSHPVEISVIGNGKALLNGKAVEDEFVVYKSGKYTLELTSGNEGFNQKYSFEINYPKGEFFKGDYANAKAAVDEENGFICLYGDSLVGVRIYDIAKPEEYLHFLPVGKTYAHCFYQDKLLLAGENGITVISRANALSGEASIEKTFLPQGIDTLAFGDDRIFGCGEGKIYSIDPETQEATLLTENAPQTENLLYSNEKLLLIAPKESNIISILDLNTLEFNSFESDVDLTNENIFFKGEYVSVGNVIFNLSGKKLLEFQAFRVLDIMDSKVFTDRYIIDINSGEEIGSFPFDISYICFGNNKTYLFGSDAEYGMISYEKQDIYSYGAAKRTDKILGSNETVNDFRTDADYIQSSVISSAVYKDNIYLLFAQRNAVYSIDITKLSEASPVYLKYTPDRIMTSEEYTAISFKNLSVLYIAPSDDIKNGEYLWLDEKCSAIAYADESLYLLSVGKILKYDYKSGILTETGLNAFDIASRKDNLYVSNDEGLIQYDSSLSVVKKASIPKGKLFIGDEIIIGKTVYSLRGFKKLLDLDSEVYAFRGSVILTKNGVYSISRNEIIGKFGIPSLETAVITENNSIVAFGKGEITITVCRHEHEITATTEISGVENGGIYVGNAKIEYTHGIGFLNGKKFESGSEIKETGKHILDIALPFGNSVSVSFTIGAQLNGIKFLSDSRVLSVGETVTLRVLYLPEGASSVPVEFSCDSKGLKVNENGEITAIATGNYTVHAKAVTEQGTFTAKCLISVRSDIIAFNTQCNYTTDRDNSLILGVTPGTLAKDVIAKLSPGIKAQIYSANGTKIEGYVGTGNKMILKNSKGEITDELTFAVVGDTDGDGFISAYDLYILEDAIKNQKSSKAISVAADINKDSRISDSDFRNLRRLVLGIEKGNMGADLENPFGSFSLQTLSHIENGDIIEAVFCVSGCKYAKALYGNLNFGNGLEFIEYESEEWDIDIYEYSDSISFYAYDDRGRICGKPFKSLITFRFRVTAQAGETLQFSSKGFKATFADGAKTVEFEKHMVKVSEPILGEPKIIFDNAVSFTFNPEIYDYSIIIPFSSAIADIGVVCGENESYTVSSCVIPDSGSKTITVGINRESGKTEYYNIQVKRDATPNIDSNCELMILEVEGFKLSPSFVSNFYEYDISVPFGTEKINVYCVAENNTAAINISDTNISPEGSQVLITVSAPDGESLVYRINVSVLPKENEESSQNPSSQNQSSQSPTEENGGWDIGVIIAWIVILSGIAFGISNYLRNKNKTQQDHQQ